MYEKQLKTKVKSTEKFLYHPHEYTPDFIFIVNKSALTGFFTAPQFLNSLVVHVDTKGTFQQNDGGRSFSINRKWMWQKFGIYIEKIVPKKLFKQTWIPEALRLTEKTKKPAAIAKGCRVISEFMQENVKN